MSREVALSLTLAPGQPVWPAMITRTLERALNVPAIYAAFATVLAHSAHLVLIVTFVDGPDLQHCTIRVGAPAEILALDLPENVRRKAETDIPGRARVFVGWAEGCACLSLAALPLAVGGDA